MNNCLKSINYYGRLKMMQVCKALVIALPSGNVNTYLLTFGNQKLGHFHHSVRAFSRGSEGMPHHTTPSPRKFLNFLCLESLKMPQIY